MKMILESDKVGLKPAPSQAGLFNDAKSRNLSSEPAGTWDIDPQGLRDSLMHFKPSTFKQVFINYNFAAANVAAANAKIVYTIDQYEVAPAVVVATGTQWLAVVGYRTDGGGNLQAVFVNDPRPPITDGTGDPPDFEVSAEIWTSSTYSYMQPVSGGKFWNNQLAMVCDPDPPKGELASAREKPRADGRQIISPEQAIEFTREILEERGTLERELFARAIKSGTPAEPQLVKILDREDQFYYLVRYQIEGQDAAVVALDARFGVFLEAIAYHRPLRFFRPTPAEIPSLLTKPLTLEEGVEDVRDRIIDWLAQNVDPALPGGIPGWSFSFAVRLARLIFSFRLNLSLEQRQPGTSAVQAPRLSPQSSDQEKASRQRRLQPSGWDMQRLRNMLDTEIARLRQPIGYREIRPEELNVHPMMVWQPSAESISMLYPFYQVGIPGQEIYIRAADGEVFTKLNSLFLQRLGG